MLSTLSSCVQRCSSVLTYLSDRCAEAAVQRATLNTRKFNSNGTTKRAILFGLNYRGTSSALGGCINDVKTMQAMLTKEYGYTEFIIMTDDTRVKPTKRNMLAAMRWLVRSTKSGDSAFMHYSGHGTSVRDTDRRKEADGKDEALVPIDYAQGNLIKDDEIFAIIKRLCPGSHTTIVVDACHSGTAADLAYQYVAFGRNRIGCRLNDRFGKLDRDIVYLSGCRDNQTSADAAGFDSHGRRTRYGALTHNFQRVLRENKFKDISIESLLLKLHRYLKQNRFSQLPEISSALPLRLSAPFGMSASFSHVSRYLVMHTKTNC